MEGNDKLLQKVKKLHQEYMVVDAHLDLPGEILIRRSSGESNIIRRYYLDSWKIAGINVIIASIFVESSMLPEMGLRNVLNQIAVIKLEIKDNEELILIQCKNDLQKVKNENKIGIVLYVEGLDFIGNDLSLLDILYDLGIRGAALTWSRDNMLGIGCCKASECVQKYGGLTSLGMKAIEKMENLGMFLDVSHLNDDGFGEVSIIAKKPFVATHSCSRTVHFSYRNLTDEQLVRLAEQGGIVGVNGCRMIVGVSFGIDPIEKMCQHILHEIKLIGAEHIGLGLDFCDSYDCARYRRNVPVSPDDCLGSYTDIMELTERLLEKGVNEQDVVRILGENFTDYLMQMLPT